MSETFTPGPWWTDAQYLEDEFGCCIIAANTDCGPLPGNPTRGQVAFAIDILPENAPICQANARLISAAPELYEALKPFAEFLDYLMSPDMKPHHMHTRRDDEGAPLVSGAHITMGDLRRARAALAKARGETE